MMFGSQPKPPVANQAPAYGALRVSTSCYGGVIGIVLGGTRATPNLVWSDDFQAIAHHSGGGGGGGGGGKAGGGGGGGGDSTSYTYRTSALEAACQGPISGIGTIWQGKTVTDMESLGGTLLEGSRGQPAWDYLTTNHPGKAISYSELACVGFSSLDLGESNSMPNLAFEVIGMGPPGAVYECAAKGHVVLQSLDLGSGLFDVETAAQVQATYDQAAAMLAAGKTPVWDTHVAWAIHAVLEGGGQFPVAAIGDLSAFSRYCQAHGFFMSVFLSEARAGNETLNDWVTATGSEFVWSGRTLQVVPYGRAAVTGNGVTFTPDTTPVYDLGHEDFIRAAADDPAPLVRVTRPKLADLYNRVKVEFLDRDNAYNVAIATAEDPAHIDTYGLREAQVIKAHQIQNAAVAQLAADMALARHLNAVAVVEFPLGWRHCRLEPMKDMVTLTDPESDLDRWLVLVTEIEEGEDGRLMVKAEEVPDGISVPRARLAFQQGESFALNVNADPGDANPPVIFEPPDALTTTGLEIWMAVSGGPQWGGADVWVSETGDNYVRVGRVVNPARTGVLSAPLVQGLATDTVNTLSVDLSESRGVLQTGDTVDATALNTLCWVANDTGDGELLAYRDATLTAPNAYELGYLVRGAHGTAITAHAAGTRFARLDGAVFKMPFRADQIGTTILVKLVSVNIWGGGAQDIALVQPHTYRIRGLALASPLPDVTGLTTAFQAGITQLVWTGVTDFRPVDYEIRQGASPATAQVIGRTPLTQAPTYGDGTYWVAAHYQVPNGGDVYSSAWSSVVVVGSQLVRNVVATYDEAASGWSGAFVNAGIGNGGVELIGTGDILAAADFLAIPNIVEYGGVAANGIYTVPVGHRIDVGRAAACVIAVTATVHGVSVNDNMLAAPDFLAISDLLGAALGPQVAATPQLRLSQDGATWEAWQDWIPGTYSARAFDFRVALASFDPQVIPVLTGFVIVVDVPDRIEDHQVALSPGGTVVAYPGGPFNGSAAGQGAPPNPQITIAAAQQGDDIILSDVTLTGFTARVINAGAGVTRTINYRSQGY